MKIAVTGASGFIGAHVINKLISACPADTQIYAASRNPEKAKLLGWPEQVRHVPCDLSQNAEFYSSLGEPDLLIHLAWTGLPNYMSLHHIESNLYHDYLFIKNMLSSGVKRLVITGTCFEYGMQNGCLSEESPTMPVTCYGLAKDCLCKMLLRLLANHSDISFCWTRFFYMYGSGQNKNSFFSQLTNAIANNDAIFNMSGGEQLRDFMRVEDAAARLVEIALRSDLHGVFNICSGQPRSLRSLAEELIKLHNSPIQLNIGYYPYTDYEPMAFWGNPLKLSTALKKT